jgi:hypothetical protein
MRRSPRPRKTASLSDRGVVRPRVTDVLSTQDRGQMAELPIAQPDLTILTAKTIAFGNDPARSSIHNRAFLSSYRLTAPQ